MARRRLHENASYFTSPSGIICGRGGGRVRRGGGGMTGARREAGKRTEISPIWSFSAFSEMADTIGWSAETRTKRRAWTSWMPFSDKFSAVYCAQAEEGW